MTSEPPERLKDLMAREGALVVFGPQFQRAARALAPDGGRAFFSAARIAEAEIPDGPMAGCTLLFCHGLPWRLGRGVTRSELEEWSAALLDEIAFRAPAAAGRSPEESAEPQRSFTADEKTNEIRLAVTWGPVASSHCVAVGRALERSYAKHGGTW
jgi:hypothetical protein